MFGGIILLIISRHKSSALKSWGATLLALAMVALLAFFGLCVHAFWLITSSGDDQQQEEETPARTPSRSPHLSSIRQDDSTQQIDEQTPMNPASPIHIDVADTRAANTIVPAAYHNGRSPPIIINDDLLATVTEKKKDKNVDQRSKSRSTAASGDSGQCSSGQRVIHKQVPGRGQPILIKINEPAVDYAESSLSVYDNVPKGGRPYVPYKDGSTSYCDV